MIEEVNASVKNKGVHYIFLLVLLLVALTGCVTVKSVDMQTSGSGGDGYQPEEAAQTVQLSTASSLWADSGGDETQQRDDPVPGTEPVDNNTYFDAIKAFREVLLGERLVMNKDNERITHRVVGGSNARFALFDLTGDGIPELILDGIQCAIYEGRADVSNGNTLIPRILKYENGVVYTLFIGDGGWAHIEILDNKMVLSYVRRTASPRMEYTYSQLNGEGNMERVYYCSMPVNIERHLERYGSSYAFKVNGEFVSQEEFEELSAPYFAIGYGMVGWTNLEAWKNEMSNGSRIILD